MIEQATWIYRQVKTSPRDSFWISIEVRHLGDMSVVYLDEATIAFIDCVAFDGGCGVVVGDDRFSSRPFTAVFDELDPQRPRARLYELPKASQELIWPVEYAGKTEDPGMVNVTSDESICRRAPRSPLLPIASNNSRDLRILTILTRAGPTSRRTKPSVLRRTPQPGGRNWSPNTTRSLPLPSAIIGPALVDRVLLSSVRQMLAESEAYGPLIVALRRADACGIDVGDVLPRLVAERELRTAADLAVVLHEPLDRQLSAVDARPRRDRLIAGLHPVAIHVGDPDLRRALDERADLLEHCARTLASQACTDHADWARRLGSVPSDPLHRAAYLRSLYTVAAYRDQWGVTTPDPLGPAARPSSACAGDRRLARHAAVAACRLANIGNDRSDT